MRFPISNWPYFSPSPRYGHL